MAAQVDGAWWEPARLAAATPLPNLPIDGIVTRLELFRVDWADVAATGYCGNQRRWEV
jgi:hypothetical protein